MRWFYPLFWGTKRPYPVFGCMGNGIVPVPCLVPIIIHLSLTAPSFFLGMGPSSVLRNITWIFFKEDGPYPSCLKTKHYKKESSRPILFIPTQAKHTINYYPAWSVGGALKGHATRCSWLLTIRINQLGVSEIKRLSICSLYHHLIPTCN